MGGGRGRVRRNLECDVWKRGCFPEEESSSVLITERSGMWRPLVTLKRAVPKVGVEVRLEGAENLNKWRQYAQTILMRMFAVNWSGMIGSN